MDRFPNAVGIVPTAPIVSIGRHATFGSGYWLMGADAGGCSAFAMLRSVHSLARHRAGGSLVVHWVLVVVTDTSDTSIGYRAAGPGSVGYDVASSFGPSASLCPPSE